VPKATTARDAMKRQRGGKIKVDSKRKTEVERGMVMRILLHSPKDTFASALAFAAVVAIMINALFLQAGRHPSPMFASTVVPLAAPSRAPAAAPASPLPRPRPSDTIIRSKEAAVDDAAPADTRSVEVSTPPAKAAVAPHPNATRQATASTPAVSSDPLGDLIISSRRTADVQRALTKFGYGQLKPTGTVGPDTRAAIQKFERERKLPVTGQISDRLVRELSAVTGMTIE